MNLGLPSGGHESPVGITNCHDPNYWGLYVSFLIFLFIMQFFMGWIVRYEQNLKIKYGNINMSEHDIVFNAKNLVTLCCLGFTGGMLAGAFGLGGGVIFNPILLTMGLPP